MTLADLVRSVIEQARPENIEPADITVTQEGPDVEIVIVPHRDLGGVSLVARTDLRGARLLWAQVHDLSTHDDLDLGVVVESIAYEGDWRARLRETLARELQRPIRLQSRTAWLRGPRVHCSISNDGRVRRIGVLKVPSQEGRASEVTTSMAGGPRPWFSAQPNIKHTR